MTDVAMTRIGPRHAWLGLTMLLAQAVNAVAAGREETTKLDCGVNALFVLLRLEGQAVTLDCLEAALPAHHPKGYSMAELAAASGSLGLGLEGVRFAKGDTPPTRPAIAFIQDAKGGHFTVLRPVGTTGTMVQVIDPPSAPWITDYDRLVTVKPWTNRILVPREPWLRRHAKTLAIASGLTVLFSFALPRLRRLGRGRLARARSAQS